MQYSPHGRGCPGDDELHGWQEVDGPGEYGGIDGLGAELEEFDARDELAHLVLVVEFGRYHFAGGDGARRRDGEFQHHLALQRGVGAQRALIERVDRPFVAVDHDVDLLEAATRLACALGAAALIFFFEQRALYHRGVARGEAGGARIAAESRDVDAAAAAGRRGGDDGAVRAVAVDVLREPVAAEHRRERILLQGFELALHREQVAARGLRARRLHLLWRRLFFYLGFRRLGLFLRFWHHRFGRWRRRFGIFLAHELGEAWRYALDCAALERRQCDCVDHEALEVHRDLRLVAEDAKAPLLRERVAPGQFGRMIIRHAHAHPFADLYITASKKKEKKAWVQVSMIFLCSA